LTGYCFKISTVVIVIVFLTLGFFNSGCGIKIETGQTTEEAVASSETKARDIRSRWARKLERSAQEDIGYLLKEHIDSTAVVLMNYGWKLAEKWHEGNRGRGELIPDHEMREIIDAWTYRERPILKAWEDNIEYAWDIIRDSGLYDQHQMKTIKEFIEQYYHVFSIVMYPNGTVESYEDNLRIIKRETESLSQSLRLELE